MSDRLLLPACALIFLAAVLPVVCGGGSAALASPPADRTVNVGGTYYIATTGIDAPGYGTQGQPWATITYALNHVPDASLVLVSPGTYTGNVRLDGNFATGVTVRSAVPYQARLRHNATVVQCFYGQGITLEGFDIAHDGPGAGGLVVQIQDLIDEPGGADTVSRIVIANNVIHDSYNNDLLKVNNGATDIIVRGNMFYNQNGSDEHIDINSVLRVTVEDNVFFNDFEGSGRPNNDDTSSFVLIKDSNGSDDTNIGSHDITVRRNVFLNYQGSTGTYFLCVGEDGMDYYEATNVLAENNLMLGNSASVCRAPMGVKGAQHITFRNNTVAGDLPSLAGAFRLNQEGANLVNDDIRFYNNVWSDPTGTFGQSFGGNNDFSDTPMGETQNWVLDHNAYWNGGSPIPSDNAELINYTNDSARLVANPLLPSLAGLVLPRWNPGTSHFADGSSAIRDVFVGLVTTYGMPSHGSPLRGAGLGSQRPTDDILGRPRPVGAPDMGCAMIGKPKTIKQQGPATNQGGG
ncbi:MAG: hypothetical protein ABI743_03830 [bacterium]